MTNSLSIFCRNQHHATCNGNYLRDGRWYWYAGSPRTDVLIFTFGPFGVSKRGFLLSLALFLNFNQFANLPESVEVKFLLKTLNLNTEAENAEINATQLTYTE